MQFSFCPVIGGDGSEGGGGGDGTWIGNQSLSLLLLLFQLFPLIESFPELIFDSIKYRVDRGAIGDWLCWLVSCWWLVGQQK